MFIFLNLILLASAIAIVYHHLLYPLWLKRVTKGLNSNFEEASSRGFRRCAGDFYLPSITMVMPAYNESQFIAEKLHNISCLDYPEYKLDVIVLCDGCSDDTAAVARKAVNNMLMSDIEFEIVEFDTNRGKNAVVNDGVARAKGEIIVLTDVSALLPTDCLLNLACHYSDPEVGVVCAGYKLISDNLEGETAYWQYQANIKNMESKLGYLLGCHGACYSFRSALFTPLSEDIINDDFVIPMLIESQGYKGIYDNRVAALELERIEPEQENFRRVRIAKGNVQQMFTLFSMLHPKHGTLAVLFGSGKVLRAVMPVLLLTTLVVSGILSLYSFAYFALFAAQLLGYTTIYLLRNQERNQKLGPIRSVIYLVRGHWCALVGLVQFFKQKFSSQCHG